MSSRVIDDATGTWNEFLSDHDNWQLFSSDDEVGPNNNINNQDEVPVVELAAAVAEMIALPFRDRDWTEIDAARSSMMLDAHSLSSLAISDGNSAAVPVPAQHADIHRNNIHRVAAPAAAAAVAAPPPPALGGGSSAAVGVERPALNVAAVAPAAQQQPQQQQQQPQARRRIATGAAATGAAGGDDNIQPRDNDVLAGRGGLGNHHVGNHRFREHAKSWRAAYQDVTSDRAKKQAIAQSVIRWVEQENHGRFLVRGKTGVWALLPNSRKYVKVAQYLRENS